MTQEQAWVEAARQGDADAFEALVRLYEKKVYALALQMCGNPEDAAEVAQEAFLACWQGLAFFRGDASFSTWLYRLTANLCTDFLRREGRRKAMSGPSLDEQGAYIELADTAPSPQEAAERRELRSLIQQGLDTLSPEHREVLVLREMHQLTYEEIGTVLDLDLGTVKSRISRGRKRLRRLLLESGNFSPPPPSKGTGKEGRP